MEIYAWCIMPSHVHIIWRGQENNQGELLKSLKTFTSKEFQKAKEKNTQESRKEWFLWMIERAGSRNSNVEKGSFWQQNNKPIKLWSAEVIDQKVDYILNNPVTAGFVAEPWHWRYSSAFDYVGGKGIWEINLV